MLRHFKFPEISGEIYLPLSASTTCCQGKKRRRREKLRFAAPFALCWHARRPCRRLPACFARASAGTCRVQARAERMAPQSVQQYCGQLSVMQSSVGAVTSLLLPVRYKFCKFGVRVWLIKDRFPWESFREIKWSPAEIRVRKYTTFQEERSIWAKPAPAVLFRTDNAS